MGTIGRPLLTMRDWDRIQSRVRKSSVDYLFQKMTATKLGSVLLIIAR
jgi:hypothetical protein